MKRLSYFLSAMLVLCCFACGNRSNPKSENIYFSESDTTIKRTTIQYIATEYDFGQVREGEKVKHTYEFKNTGDADLLLQNVTASCGCTTPDYSKKPVRPGKKGRIEVVFNTKGRPGQQRKTVRVVTNTEPSTTVLSFTCEVLPAEKE